MENNSSVRRFEWSPNDFAPTFDIELDENGQVINVHGVYTMPAGWPDREPLHFDKGEVMALHNSGRLRDPLALFLKSTGGNGY